MRHPLALVGFTALLCNIFLVLFGYATAGIFCGVAALPAMGSILLFRIRANHITSAVCAICVTAVCSFLIFGITAKHSLPETVTPPEDPISLTVTVKSPLKTFETAGRCTVTTCSPALADGHTLRFSLTVDRTTRVEVGDVLQGQFILTAIPESDQPAYFAERISLFARPAEKTILYKVGHKESFLSRAEQVRRWIEAEIDSVLSGQAAVMTKGVCVGNIDGMNARLSTRFYAAGLGHIVAVSGLHTNAVSGLLLLLFICMRASNRWSKLLSVAFVWAFVAVTGFSFSAMRSAIMFSLLAVNTFIIRRVDLLNSLGGACLLILLLFPCAGGDVGFCASVAATGGLILWATPLSKRLERCLPKFLATAVAVTFSATLAVIPCNLMCFYRLPLLSVVTNLIAVPLSTLVMVTGLCGVGLYALTGFSLPGRLLLQLAGLLADGLIGWADVMGSIPFGQLFQVTVWSLLAAVGSVCILLFHRIFARRGVALVSAVVLLFLGSLPAPYPADTYEITLLKSVNAISVVVSGREGTVVIDGGVSAYGVQDTLYSRGQESIDCLITSMKTANDTNLYTYLQTRRVKEVVATPTLCQSLEPIVKDTLLTHCQQVTVGAIAVTITADHRQFEVEVDGTTVSVFVADPPDCLPACAVTPDHFAVNGAVHPLEQRTVLRLHQGRVDWYIPRTVY